jgi:hypothetical protein
MSTYAYTNTKEQIQNQWNVSTFDPITSYQKKTAWKMEK